MIERIKSEISLLRLVKSQGHQPKKQGKDYAIRCSFHEGENTPSLIISPKSNLYHCFGCDAAGSVIDWVRLPEKNRKAGALKASDEIILCEALIDAMTFWVHGSYGFFLDGLMFALMTDRSLFPKSRQ